MSALAPQVGGSILRPKHGVGGRRAWELLHKANGYVMWGLAIVVCVMGTSRIDTVRSRYYLEPISGSSWVAVLVAAGTSGASLLLLEMVCRIRFERTPAHTPDLPAG